MAALEPDRSRLTGLPPKFSTSRNLISRYRVEYPVEESNNCVAEISCAPPAYQEEGLKRLGVDTFFDPRGSGADGCGYRIRDCGAA